MESDDPEEGWSMQQALESAVQETSISGVVQSCANVVVRRPRSINTSGVERLERGLGGLGQSIRF